MIEVIGCLCGSTNSLVRNFLKSANYPDWLDVPIVQGKERSLAVLNHLPNVPEKEMLRSLLSNASKWAVIIGYDENSMKWSDISHNGVKSRIEASLVVEYYG